MFRACLLTGLLAAFAVLCASSPARAQLRSGSSDDLIAAFEAADEVVIGQVRNPVALDRAGRTARFEIQRSLPGTAPSGRTVTVAWEELAPTRALRFVEGERLLLALEPLEQNTLWKKRLPDPKERVKVRAISQKGRGFLRRPTTGTTLALEHFLRLAPETRRGPTGVGHVASLAVAPDPALARSAVRWLTRVEGLDAKLTRASSKSLLRALALEGRPQLRTLTLELVGSAKLLTLREPLKAAADAEVLAAPAIYDALGRLDGELEAKSLARLGASADARYRALAARFATRAQATVLLVDSLLVDSNSSVRAAAVSRLVEIRGTAAIPTVIPSLSDGANTVRAAAARALGSLGPPAVPALRGLLERDALDDASLPAAQAALAALSLCGRAGVEVLIDVKRDHPNEHVRSLATLALGSLEIDPH